METAFPVFPRYKVLREIGSGGMGVVYQCARQDGGAIVAVKLLRQEMLGQAALPEMFESEARAAQAIDHPNVIKVLEVARSDAGPFIAMEFVKGSPLSRVISQKGRLSVREALAIARDVAAGLAAAHGAGVIHRDVKPSNIMLTDAGKVKVLDFGIARVLESVNPEMLAHGVISAGTPEYMAPEQGQGLKSDARSDIYSLGIVLYEMLVGAVPFKGSRLMVTLSHAQDEPAHPSAVVEGIPREVDDLVMAMLQKNPDKRVQTAAETREKMAAILGDTAPAEKILDMAGAGAGEQDAAANEDEKPTTVWQG